MNQTMKTRMLGSLKSSRAERHFGRGLLLLLLAATASAQGQSFPWIDVTNFAISNSGIGGFTVTSGGITTVVSNEKADTGIINPSNVTYGVPPNMVGSGNNDAPAFQAALNVLSAAGGGHIYIPNGSYRLDQQVSVSNIRDKGRIYTIEGQSEAGVLIYCNNSTGAFKITSDMRDLAVTMRDMTLIADTVVNGTTVTTVVTGTTVASGTTLVSGTTVTPSDGTAIEIQIGLSNFGVGEHTLTADHITMKGRPGTQNYFKRGLVLMGGASRPLITDCTFRGLANAQDVSDNSVNFKAKYGFQFDQSYGAEFRCCKVTGAEIAYEMQVEQYIDSGKTGPLFDKNGSPIIDPATGEQKIGPLYFDSRLEGGSIIASTAEYCKIGVHIWRTPENGEGLNIGDTPLLTSKGSAFFVRECKITARDCGLFMEARRFFNISDNCFVGMPGYYSSGKDIELRNCGQGSVSNNQFPSTPARINIPMDSNCSQATLIGNFKSVPSAAASITSSGTSSYIYIR